MDVIGASIMIALVAVLLALGMYGWKVSKKTVYDYALAGGALGYLVTIAYSAATLASTATLMGFMGQHYAIGITYYAYLMMPIWHVAAIQLFIGTRLLAARELYKIYSPIQAIAYRYGSRLIEILVAILWFFLCSIYAAMQFTAVGTTLQPIFDIPFEWAVVASAVIVLIYVLLGGARSVAWTNLVFFVVMLIGFWIPAVIILIKYPVLELARQVAQSNPELFMAGAAAGYTLPLFVWTLIVQWFAGLGFVWGYMPPMSARNVKVVKVTALASWTNYIVYILPGYVIAAIIGRAVLPDLKRPDLVFYVLASKLPYGFFTSVYAAAVISAGLSTAATLVMLQGLFVEADIIGALGLKLSERSRLAIIRLTSVAGVTLGLILALVMRLPVGLFFSYAFGFMGITVPATIGALFWKRGTKYGAYASLLLGVLVYILGHFVSLPIPGPMPRVTLIPPQLLWGFTVASISYIVVSLMTKHAPEEKVKEFVDDLAEWIRNNC